MKVHGRCGIDRPIRPHQMRRAAARKISSAMSLRCKNTDDTPMLSSFVSTALIRRNVRIDGAPAFPLQTQPRQIITNRSFTIGARAAAIHAFYAQQKASATCPRRSNAVNAE